MAKVLNPLHSIDASGKVGPLIYTHAGPSNIVRRRVYPSDQHTTPRQAQLRGFYISASGRYGPLDTAQRQSWKDLAKRPDRYWRGRSIRTQMRGGRSEIGHFYRRNIILADAGEAMILFALAYAAWLALPALNIGHVETGLRISWTPPEAPPGAHPIIRIWRQGPRPPHLKPDWQHAVKIAHRPPTPAYYDDLNLRPGRYTYWVDVLDGDVGTVSTPLMVSDVITD